MCENCGDPECTVKFYNLEGREVPMAEWSEIIEQLDDSNPDLWDGRIKVGFTRLDGTPFTVMTAWQGITKGEEPPQLWATSILTTTIPASFLGRMIDGGEDLVDLLESIGETPKNFHLVAPLKIAESKYPTRESATAGHDQWIARILADWSATLQRLGMGEQLKLEPQILLEDE